MLRVIILFGLISLLGDFIYEGARSVYGPFFNHLGVDPFVFGVIIGLGEFLAYSLRILSGYVSDRIRDYWTLTIAGYFLIIAIPLLGFAKSWMLASILILIERIGKGLRTPARDTILSFVTKKVGRGLGFGIHEALDQFGAVLGPLTFSLLLIYGYETAFKSMFIPFIALISLLIFLRIKLPNPESVESESRHNPTLFKKYLVFVLLSGLGFVNFPLLAYHYSKFISPSTIPVLYAFAMVVDAVFAPIIGKVYDVVKLKSLILIPALTILSAFSFFNPLALIFFGMAMAMHEAVMRAVVADYVGVSKRSTAYGIFNAFYGLALFLSSSVVGYLYPNLLAIILYVATFEVLGGLYAYRIGSVKA
ncbi:MFS transporter [Archaeoglobus profundus]|uniref:Major facilitator superfamily MFS_1 n=1 Tax=Archaeoglobus profundus (strain DSM 5631 / JCM 9629 / NBRC 100127 / Av18) TaxID=572546 RepID=D2RHR6_ARCPA|nr:MFS transporter [Archaeoglobus profundus]ADB57841.1 major facilitator superfamily MFS_1 [Archaeoglobus profundus DSM 5631]